MYFNTKRNQKDFEKHILEKVYEIIELCRLRYQQLTNSINPLNNFLTLCV